MVIGLAKGKITPAKLMDMKMKGERIVMVTAYDYPSAKLADMAGIDVILVGDSLGIFILGFRDTRRVTIDDIIHHSRPVSRAVERALTVGDMPFATYLNMDMASINASRIIRDGGVDTVKIEGGSEVSSIVRGLVMNGIHVMGHIGYTPQKMIDVGAYPVQGLSVDDAMRIINDAVELEKAGVYALILEFVAAEVAKVITGLLEIPVIGIGSGPYCDGQVLVLHDVIGLRLGDQPPYSRSFGNVGQVMMNALEEYARNVRSGSFPTRDNYVSISRDNYSRLVSIVRDRYGYRASR